jgi:glycosyltransferase involved in cell wall biosynthesis
LEDDVAPRFTVIITTHDRPVLVGEALRSVLAQTVDDFEVIVVDDASEDPLNLPSDPRVRLIIHETKKGVSAARNTGIEMAAGEYICFLDDDDLYTSDRLEIADEGLVRSPVTVCSKRFVSADGSIVHRSATDDVRYFMASRWLHVGQFAIRRDLIPHFNVRLVTAEDHEWAIQIVQLARPRPVDRVGYIVQSHGEEHLAGSRYPEQLFHDWELMLSLRADFFQTRPKLLMWQWKLLGGKLMQQGDRRLARRAFLKSMRVRPDVRTAYHLLRTWI